MRRLLARLRRDVEGATSIEYALIAVLVSIAAIIAMTALSTAVQNLFNFVASVVTGIASGL